MGHGGLERRVGRLLVVGLPAGPLSPDWERRFCDLAPSGVILFGRNVESPDVVSSLIRRLQDLAAAGGFSPLLVCADEEGGFLSPILGPSDPAPAAMAVGSVGSSPLAFEAARVVGGRLRRVGVNLNLAPCVDVNDEPRNPVIGPRSFGADPALVARLGAETIRGLKAGGVLTTAKHFPGHGSTTTDSHVTLPVDGRSPSDLESSALGPFRAAVEAGVDLVMTAHVSFPALTGRPDLPATLSEQIVGEWLRRRLAFRGVVITDAMEMIAVTRVSFEEAALQALSAGADLVLYTLGDEVPWRVRDFLAGRVGRGPLAKERIEERLRRIAALKEAVPERAPESSDRRVFDEIRRRAVTVLEDPGGLLPLALRRHSRVAVVVPNPGLSEGAIDVAAVVDALRQKRLEVEVVEARPESSVSLGALRGCDAGLVFTLSRGPLDPWQAEITREAARTLDRCIVVAAFNPWALPDLDRPAARLATYDFSPPSIRALVERVFAA